MGLSRRPFLLLRIYFPGRPIFIQFFPGWTAAGWAPGTAWTLGGTAACWRSCSWVVSYSALLSWYFTSPPIPSSESISNLSLFQNTHIMVYKGLLSLLDTETYINVHILLGTCIVFFSRCPLNAFQEQRFQIFWEYQPKSIATVWQLLLYLTDPNISCLEQDSLSSDEEYWLTLMLPSIIIQVMPTGITYLFFTFIHTMFMARW